MNMCTKSRANIIRAKVHAGALYGCAACDVSKQALSTYTAAVLSTIGVSAKHRSADLTSALYSHGPDLDPEGHILAQRVVALKRHMVKQVDKGKENIKSVLERYREQRQLGTNEDPDYLELLKAAPQQVAKRGSTGNTTTKRADRLGSC